MRASSSVRQAACRVAGHLFQRFSQGFRRYQPWNREPEMIDALESRRLLTHAVQDFGFIVSELSGFDQTCNVAVDADGDFVVVWEGRFDNTSNRDIRARLYNHFGNPKGDEFEVNPPAPATALQLRVAMDATGDFVVGWTGGNFRLYNANGTPKTDRLRVSTDADMDVTDVAMEDNGDFVAAWINYPNQVGSPPQVRARRFDADGTALAAAFTVITTDGTGSDFPEHPAVAMDADGDFVVVYERGSQFGGKDIRARRYTNTGAAAGSEFTISTTGQSGSFSLSGVAMDDAGDFVVAGRSGTTQIRARRYDSAGTALGSSFKVNTDSNVVEDGDVTMGANGDFTVVWTDHDDGFITGRRFSSAGVAESNEFNVDIFTPFPPFGPAVAAEDDGSFVSVWVMFIGGDYKVFAKQFSTDETAPAAPDTPDLLSTSDRGRSISDNITNDDTPTFAGFAEPGSLVSLLVDGVEAATDEANSSGFYQVTVPNAFNLSDGPHTFRTRTMDDGGNVSPLSTGTLSVTIDTVAPVPPSAPDLSSVSDKGISNSDNITNASAPNLGGTSESTSIITVYANGVDVTTSSFARIGTIWSMTVSALTDGVKTMTFTEEDVAGNVSAPSPGLAITIDTVAPSSPTIAPDLTTDTGSSATDNLTNDNTPSLGGSVTAGLVVRLFEGATELGLDSTTSGGAYSIISSTLSDGAHSLTVRFEDVAGNQSAAVSPALSITIDTVAPSAPTIAPNLTTDTGRSATDNVTKDNTPDFAGSVPAGLVVELFDASTLVGSDFAPAGGMYSVTSAVLGEGAHSISARFGDAAGNFSTSGPTLPITIDTIVPAQPAAPDMTNATDSGKLNNDDITNFTQPAFTGTIEANARVSLKVDGFSVGTITPGGTTYTAAPTSALINGNRSVTITQEDLAGNVSIDSPALVVTIDTIAPAAPSTPDLPADKDSGASNTDNVTNILSSSLVLAGPELIRLQLNNITTADYLDPQTRPITYASDGSYTWRSISVDLAGNTSAASAGLTVNVDTLAPTVTTSAFDFLTGQDVRFSFSENVGPTLAVADLTLSNLTTSTNISSALIALSYTPNNGTFTFPGLPSGILPDGNYLATLTASGVTDLAGNPLAINPTLSFFVLTADANRDRKVDFNDLVILAQNYNTSGKTFSFGDFSYDGNVDFNDLVILAQRYNTTLAAPALSVPEAIAPVRPTPAASAAKNLFSLQPIKRPLAKISKPIARRR